MEAINIITEVIIKTLSEDATIQTLLDAVSQATCPVSTTSNFDNTVDKQINVEYSRGTTLPYDKDVSDGSVNVHILIKDTISDPINLANGIAVRVLELLDLAGTSLSTTNYIHWLQKIDDDWTHYNDIHFYEYTITFRWVLDENVPE